jgi:hypothetical protein
MDRESRKRRLERYSRNEKILPGEENATAHCMRTCSLVKSFAGKERRQ